MVLIIIFHFFSSSSSPSGFTADVETCFENGVFKPPLYRQRYDYVIKALSDPRWEKHIRKVSYYDSCTHFLTNIQKILCFTSTFYKFTGFGYWFSHHLDLSHGGIENWIATCFFSRCHTRKTNFLAVISFQSIIPFFSFVYFLTDVIQGINWVFRGEDRLSDHLCTHQHGLHSHS